MSKLVLEIFNEEYSESPRVWDNLGYFIIVSSKYSSPDCEGEWQKEVIKDTSKYAISQENHIERIKKEFKKRGEEIHFITPVGTYEHGSRSFYIGTRHGWDYSNNGFYIVTKNQLKGESTEESYITNLIESELDIYEGFINGEVYGFTIEDGEGNHIDSCGGFFKIDDIKEHLPEEFKGVDLSDYIK